MDSAGTRLETNCRLLMNRALSVQFTVKAGKYLYQLLRRKPRYLGYNMGEMVGRLEPFTGHEGP